MIKPEFQTVFDTESGPTENYRIPSMVVTKSGVTVACADSRYFTCGDNPNRIEKVVRRSFDSGKTWSEVKTIVSEIGEKKEQSSASIDPVMVYNPDTDRIVLMFCHTPSGIGILNCRLGVGEDSDGNRILYKGVSKCLLKDGKIYKIRGKNLKYTGYTADGRGYYFKDGQDASEGNYKIKGKFKEMNTAYLMMCVSDDGGENWSKPVCINRMVKKPYMGFIGPGPGIGITLSGGARKGRMAVPIYFNTISYPLRLSCAVIYSDDNGETWTLGKAPVEARVGKTGKKLDPKRVRPTQMTTEAQLIEREDGSLKIFMRNHDKSRCVATAVSDDGGESWRDFKFVPELPQPICQCSVLKFYKDGKPMVLFVNAASKTRRVNGTARLSLDDGETFPYSKKLCDGEFVYSCSALLPDGNIGVLYEGETVHTKIDFAKFPPEWLTENDENGENGNEA